MKKVLAAGALLWVGAVCAQTVQPPIIPPGSTPPVQIVFRAISPTAYGAKCDGSTDDSTAITTWAAALVSNTAGYIPGKCVFKTPIAIAPSGASNLTIYGDGANSQLIYSGASTTATPITIGAANVAATGCSVYNLTIHDFDVLSTTSMTAGTGFVANEICQGDFMNFSVGRNLGASVTWYDAAKFYGGNTVHWRGYSFVGSHKGVIVAGDNAAAPGPYQFTDPIFSQGIAVGASVAGVNIAGAVGGFEMDQDDKLLNGTNVLIDQSVAGRANIQLYFLGGSFTDATSGGTGIGVDLNDAGTTNSILVFKNSWLATATNECLKIETGTSWHVVFHGGEVINCHGLGGILNNSINTVLDIEGTLFDQNSTHGVNNAASSVQVTVQSARQGLSGTNDFVGPLSGTYINPANNIISNASSTGAVTSGTTQVVGTKGNCSTWFQNGIMIPGASDFSVAGCTFALGTVSFPFSSMVRNADIMMGTAPTVSGCTVNTQVGGNTAGSFLFNGACAAPITLTFATTTPHGWSCTASNMSAGTNLVQNGYSTTTAAFVNPAASNGQQVQFSCHGF